MTSMKTQDARHDERAVVNYLTPKGIDALVLRDGDSVEFGRGGECQIRFGYAPQPDLGVPRVAGQLMVVNQRVFIGSSNQTGHRVIEVRTENGPTRQIALGEGFSPRENRFDIFVTGEREPWKLSVSVRPPTDVRESGTGGDPPTKYYELNLTNLQRAVLEAYFEPMSRGRLEPATHKEVAASLSYHSNTVREALYEVWAKMFEQDMPMPDVSDKRIAVVEAARVHGLLSGQP
jgi:hypothetical protein